MLALAYRTPSPAALRRELELSRRPRRADGVVVEAVAARLRLEHQGKGGIADRIDPRRWVHLTATRRLIRRFHWHRRRLDVTRPGKRRRKITSKRSERWQGRVAGEPELGGADDAAAIDAASASASWCEKARAP